MVLISRQEIKFKGKILIYIHHWYRTGNENGGAGCEGMYKYACMVEGY